AKVEALVSIHVPATRNERGSWPECFCMLNSCVQLEHVSPRDNLVQNRERRRAHRLRRTLTLVLSSQRCRYLYLAQALDQRFHTSSAQRLDQFVGGSFMCICQ